MRLTWAAFVLLSSVASGQVVSVEHVALRLSPGSLVRIVRADSQPPVEGRFQLVGDSTIVLQDGRRLHVVGFSAIAELWTAEDPRRRGAAPGALIGALTGGVAFGTIGWGLADVGGSHDAAVPLGLAGVALGGLVGAMGGAVLGGPTYRWERRIP